MKKWRLSTTQLILLGFLAAILIGTVLLSLPFATANGQAADFSDALFTAASSVCVAGLTVVDTARYWSIFGEIVILILIQCGALGIVSFTTAILMLLHKRINLKERLLLGEALNLSTLGGLVKFLRDIFKFTFAVELAGIICFSFILIPEYGPKGIYYAIFHSVSAFCNSGMDIFGGNSLEAFRYNWAFCGITMLLIVMGGVGFPVWFDILQKRRFRKFKLHSKLVLTCTGVLLVLGTVFLFLAERNNPATLGGESLPSQLFMSLFQSVTIRSAGFSLFPQEGLTDASTLFCMMFMFVGGSPIGTAGGIKTTTLVILALTVKSLVRGNSDCNVFGRRISADLIKKALGIATFSIFAVFFAILLMLMMESKSFLDLSFEVVSAMTTVGITRNMTQQLSGMSRYLIIICMFLGRIGPITMAFAFGKKREHTGKFKFPEEDIPVG